MEVESDIAPVLVQFFGTFWQAAKWSGRFSSSSDSWTAPGYSGPPPEYPAAPSEEEEATSEITVEGNCSRSWS